MKDKELKEIFKRLLDNNKDEDWDNLIFRETMADAFRFASLKVYENMKKDVLKVIDNTEEWIDYACDDDGNYVDVEESVKWLKEELKKAFI